MNEKKETIEQVYAEYKKNEKSHDSTNGTVAILQTRSESLVNIRSASKSVLRITTKCVAIYRIKLARKVVRIYLA